MNSEGTTTFIMIPEKEMTAICQLLQEVYALLKEIAGKQPAPNTGNFRYFGLLPHLFSQKW